MRKDKKYMMIVTEEDERYNGKDVQLSFYANNPFEGKLSDVVYGDNVDELRISTDGYDNEGLFYVLYATEDGTKVGSGTVEFSAIAEEIEEYEENNSAKVYTCRMTKTMTFDIKANSMEEAQEWCATHDFEDVEKESTYWSVDYSEDVSDLEDDGYVAVDISY